MAKKKRKKAIILIPLTYNDGTRIPKGTLEAIYDEMYTAFQGWTIEGEVRGAYRVKTGKKRVEKLVRLAVVLDKADVPSLRKMVAKWCSILGQETMLLEITDSVVEFVPPGLEEE